MIDNYNIDFRAPVIKERFRHWDELKEVAELTEAHFEEKPNLEIVSINRVYKVVFPSGRTPMKIRAVFRENITHEVLVSSGIEVPRIITRLQGIGGIDYRFTEWLEGFTYKDSLKDIKIYDEMPDKHYYKLGRLLGRITNIKVRDKMYSMSDIYWTNFLIHGEEVYLTDTSKVHLSTNPEYFFIKQVLLDQFIPGKKKAEAILGYFDGLNNRDKNDVHQDINLLRQFTGGIYVKLDRQ